MHLGQYSVTFAIHMAGFVPREQSSMTIQSPVRTVPHPALGVTPIYLIPPDYDSRVVNTKSDTRWVYLATRNLTN